MEGISIHPADKATLAAWVRDLLARQPPSDAFWLPVLFGGDRLLPVDGAFVAREGERVVGAVTFSLQGEQGEGPEIIGLYVLPAYRRRGLGTRLLLAAYEELVRRGAASVRVLLLSPAARALVRRVQAPRLQAVDVTGG